MTSSWTVPNPPRNTNPLGLSSIQIFNGLEDGGGIHDKATLILQPVIQQGKSGCIVDPLLYHQWHLTSYVVDGNGHAHCGPRIRIEVGEKITGTMSMQKGIGSESGNNTWTISSVREKTGEKSELQISLTNDIQINAAQLTLEGMLIQDCRHQPDNDHITFQNNVLKDGLGQIMSDDTFRWKSVIRHTECGQTVDQDAERNEVKLIWNSDL